MVKQYEGKVRVVYKNMIVHDFVAKGHLGGCAASKQGKFNEYRHAWWEKAWGAYAQSRGDKSKLGDEAIDAIATDLKLDMAKFKADIASPECNQRIQQDVAELQKWHVNSTPSFFINGQHFSWDGDPHSFKTAIDEKIAAVESSGVKCADYYDKVVMEKGEKKFRSMKEPKPN
jgi:protein-disulfide isomerase